MASQNHGEQVIPRVQRAQSIPFSIRLLVHEGQNGHDDSQTEAVDISALLPAAWRTAEDNLEVPVFPDTILSCIDKELDLNRLEEIHDRLWLVGRPMPPRPLHYQNLLGRVIRVTEQMDMHLVWGNGNIFIKPIPRFLLEPQFWKTHLWCEDNQEDAQCICNLRWQSAFGFLFSYTALITHESDFRIAQEKYLLPSGVKWPAWRAFVQEILSTENTYSRVNKRFHYGELRLSRLNKLYYLWKTPLRAYQSRWNQYASFFRQYFTLLASITVYLAIVLTAMQVGLAVEPLRNNATFPRASYGFTVFSILGPAIIVCSIMLVFLCFFIGNWIATVKFRGKRMGHIKHGITGETLQQTSPV